MRKKILWLSHFLPYPPKGGNLQRSYNLLKELSKYNDVTVLAFNQKAICPTDAQIQEGIDHLSQFCRIAAVYPIASDCTRMDKYLLLIKSLLPWKTYTIEWLNSRAYADHLANLLQMEEFDLLHVDTISLFPLIKNPQNYTIALTHHNIESQMLKRRAANETHLLKKCLYAWEAAKLERAEKRICPQVALNITCSSLDSIRLEMIAPGIKCIDIPNGVDLNYFHPIAETRLEKSLVFAGGLTWYPNLAAMSFFLKSVWPKLQQEIPDITMTVIGRSPPAWMLAMQEQYPKLKVTGFVDDVRPYIDSACIYICPINDGGGTKLKILDALAMGKAIIAHPIACEGIEVENHTTVVFAQTPEEYITEIKALLLNSDKIQRMEQAAFNLAKEKYDFVKLGEKLNEAYVAL